MAEECETLQARSGSQVGHCASVQYVCREEVGPPVLSWLAGAATSDLSRSHPPPPHPQQPLPQAAGGGGGDGAGPAAAPSALSPRLVSLAVRCLGAWCRLGCLHAARCPVPAVRELLALALGCAHPAGGAPAALRHEACEALGDVIEHGPDPLLRELHSPLVQLADAAAAAELPGGGDAAHTADTDAVYDIVQLVSSYAAARLGELVAAACGSGGAHIPTPPPLDSAAVAAAAAEPDAAAAAAALVGSLCRLAALPAWTEGGYPVSWPAMLALTDLAVGCITAVPPPPPPPPPLFAAAEAAVAEYGVGGAEGDAMQQDSGAEPLPAETDTGMGTGALPGEEPAPGREHCVPDITLGPRPGLPPPLVIMYDNVLRSVLSCCVAWSLMDTGAAAAGTAAAGTAAAGAAAAVADAGDGAVEAAAAGLLRLPPECDEALRGCLQACGGVVGQVRQLETAVALLQHHNAAESATTAAAAVDGWPQTSAPMATSAAALTAALAAVAACGALPVPTAAAAETADGATAAAAAAIAAARILLAAAERLHGTGAAAGLPGPPLPPPPQLVLAVPLMLQYCEALVGSCKAVLQLSQPYPHTSAPQPAAAPGLAVLAGHVGREGGPGGGGGGEAGGGLPLHRLAEPTLKGLRHESTAVAAARALWALVAAARELALPLPAPLAAELADAVHALPYDVGPGYLAAERELVRAAVAAAAGTEGPRADMWQRLLSPAVATTNKVAAAAAAPAAAAPTASASSQQPLPEPQPPPPPPLAAPPSGSLPPAAAATTPNATDNPAGGSGGAASAASRAVVSRQQDAALARQLRLFDAALEQAAAAASVTGPSLDATIAGVFVHQAWPALRALLRVGGAGRFLLLLCRCLAAVLRRAAASGGGGGAVEGTCDGAAAAEAVDDPWVVSVLGTLADCVGRPGAKHVYEPLIALLEGCTAPVESPPPLLQQPEAGAPGAPLCPLLQHRQEQQERQRWRRRHAALVARTLTDILYGGVASALAATWRAADRDPDTAECLLRLATAAVRYGGPAAHGGCGAEGGGAAIVDNKQPPPASAAAAASPATSQASTTRAAVAAAALRLAAASSGCDHRQVASAALMCTCAVLEAACGSWPSVAGGLDGGGAGGDVAAAELRQLLAAVLQLGPQVVAGLLAALLSSSPLPRLQRVATALVLLGAAVAACFDLERQQQQQHLLPDAGGAPGAKALEACSRLLGSWLVAAAAYLQLPEHEGAALAASWGPLLAETGLGAAAVAACSGGGRATPQRPPLGGASLTSPSPSSSSWWGPQPQGGAASAARGLSRKLRRLLREFVESRLRP